MFDMSEEGHADYCVDEGDEGEQGANVEQRGQRHDQREQQFPNAFRRLKRIHFVCGHFICVRKKKEKEFVPL